MEKKLNLPLKIEYGFIRDSASVAIAQVTLPASAPEPRELVHYANVHPELVAALEKARAFCVDGTESGPLATLNIIEAALSKAKDVTP